MPETQSFREMWSGGDLSHGWCSTPLVQMSSRILGVRPTSPEFKTFEIAPRLCDLKWAKGAIPTPHGDIRVSWKQSEKRFDMDVTIPKGTEAMVSLPLTTFLEGDVSMNGKPLLDFSASRKTASPQAQLPSGHYTFVVTGIKPNSPYQPHQSGKATSK